MPDVPLDGPSIRAYLAELADTLPVPSDRRVIVVVGGSLLAMRGLRDTTLDIDSVRRLDAALKEAARAVAVRHGLEPDAWLNDRAAPFRPRTLLDADCDVLLDHPQLLVLGAPLEQVFLMKINAHRARDYDDLVVLWPQCWFESPSHAAQMYAEAYPHEQTDPFLADFIAALESAGGRR